MRSSKSSNRKKLSFEQDDWLDERNLAKIRNKRKWAVEQLSFMYIDSEVIGDIEYIQFTKLKYLALVANNMDFLEGLSRISMINLQTLALWKNDIISLKDLKKANWPHLKEILLSQNHISDAQVLIQSAFPRISFLEMDQVTRRYWIFCDHNFFDIRFLLKLETKILKRIYICSERLRTQKYIIQMMKKKWPVEETYEPYVEEISGSY